MIGYLFAVLIVLAILEFVLSVTWNSLYFRFGIPIYIRKIQCRSFYPIPDAIDVEAAIPKDRWPTIQVRSLAKDRLVFRESFFFSGANMYTPVMRGNLRFDKVTEEVILIGYLNWGVGLFDLLFLMISTQGHILEKNNGFIFLAFFVLLSGFIYVTQVIRFNKVAQAAAMAWEKPELEMENYWH